MKFKDLKVGMQIVIDEGGKFIEGSVIDKPCIDSINFVIIQSEDTAGYDSFWFGVDFSLTEYDIDSGNYKIYQLV